MNRIKSVILLMCIAGLMACNQKKNNVTDGENGTEQVAVSSVEVPKFSDQVFQEFVEEYDAFMNKALVMYDNDEFNSAEGKAKQERFQKDAKIYLNKMGKLLSDADEKELTKFQTYILSKQVEMENRTKNLIEK